MNFLSFFALLFSALPILAQAACGYHLTLRSASTSVADSDQVIQQGLQVWRDANTTGEDCSRYRVYFGMGQANSYTRKAFKADGSSIGYNLHKDVSKTGVLKDVNDTVSDSERLTGEALESGVYYDNQFHVSIPNISSQGFPPSGTYTDSLPANLHSLNAFSENVFEESASFALSIVVPQRLSISLVDIGGAFDASMTTKTLDLGDLGHPSEKEADLVIQSNTPYHVSISSLNNGQLKHSGGAGIQYRMKVNGLAIDLSSSSMTPLKVGEGGSTSEAGHRHRLTLVNTGDIAQKPAGTYTDSITVTATAN